MPLNEIKTILQSCEKPLDFFGDVTLEEISKKYKQYAKYCHPDLVKIEYKSLAEEIFKMLNELYEKAIKEYKEGIYNITDKKELYKRLKPIIEFDFNNKNYKYYKDLGYSDVTSIYEGLCENELILMKIVSDEVDNDLLLKEYELLRKLEHHSLPKIISMIKINGKNALIYKKSPGYSIDEIIKYYGKISGSHIAWMLERMLSLIGYLHSNKIVHGNIKPDNIVIDPDMHNVYIEDYSLAITNANEKDKKYTIINENFTPSYVTSSSKVIPHVDIYAIGKIAIMLIGGDIKSNGMPLSCELKLRTLIRKLVDEKERANDAWALWDELIAVRNEIYGTQRFQKLERKL